ncbi:MAG: hypothetical protein RLZZ196_1427, partial [Bacteroidota bacterium]
WVNLKGAGIKAQAAAKLMADSTMPDISGLKLQDALWLCERAGLQVKCVGKGKVVKQSIAQGSYITKGQPILIELN